MKSKSDRIAAIVQLTEASFAASQARLSAIARREQELRSNLDGLRASAQVPSDDGLDNPALRAGADMLWQRWAEDRRRKLNIELAQTLVLKGQAKAALAADFGRCEAIRGVQKQLNNEVRADKARRAERDGPS